MSLMTSLKGTQLVKKRKQLVIIPILSPIEDIVPLVDGTHVEAESVDADELPLVVQDLEDDSELKRSWMMCPIHMRSVREGSRPQISRRPWSGRTLSAVMTLISDAEESGGSHLWPVGTD